MVPIFYLLKLSFVILNKTGEQLGGAKNGVSWLGSNLNATLAKHARIVPLVTQITLSFSS